MPWRLIDDCCEIDNDLITCAEYQLFLHETETNRQPFHWESDHFLPGMAKLPITGIKPDDAVAFCTWLNEQESTGFEYRLPTLGEANQAIVTPSPLGYWCTEGETFVIGGIDRAQWQIWQDTHLRLLEFSCLRDLVDGLILLLESICDLDIDLILTIDRCLYNSRKLNMSNNRIRARNHSLKRIREQIRQSACDLGQDLARVTEFAVEIKQEFILEQERVFERLPELAAQLERNLLFDSDVVLDLDLVRDIDVGLQGKLILDLDLAHYLATYRDRLLLQSRNLASLLTLDIVPKLTQSLLATQDFTQTVNKIAELDLKQVNNLTRELEQALALSRTQNQQRQKPIDLAFDCLKYFLTQNNYTVARYCLLLISASWYWLSRLDYSNSNLPQKKIKKLQEDHTKQQEQVLSLYSAFLLLAERKTGVIPPWEGLRLVRNLSY